ncbi:MAG: hypothetical protein E7282_05330 [Lachnospiraceae bacterium]|nr:hypothetical protein [Lachnospiraceae bacterium]
MSKRYAKDRTKERYGPKIEKVNISEKYFWPRVIAAGVLLVIGGITLGYSCSKFFGADSGWQEISTDSSEEINYGSEFTLYYNIGASGVRAGVESRELTALYTQAQIDAYAYFNSDQESGEYANIYDINQSPNTVLTVSDALYQAFETMEAYDARWMYLGPIYASYSNLFSSEDDVIAEDYDPYQNTELETYYAQIAAYAADESQISIELLGDNQVRLNVSDEYMSFITANGIDQLIEFDYMRNAFVSDYVAGVLADAGYTNGCLTSYDGYINYLDDGEYSYSYTIYDRDGTSIQNIAEGSIAGMKSAVVFKDFAVADLENYRYYIYSDGTARTSYISIEDGKDYAATPYLYAASDCKSCAEVLLQMLPVYVQNEFDADAAFALESEGIYALYTKDQKAQTNLPNNEYN